LQGRIGIVRSVMRPLLGTLHGEIISSALRSCEAITADDTGRGDPGRSMALPWAAQSNQPAGPDPA
jgi:hypothetical protein